MINLDKDKSNYTFDKEYTQRNYDRSKKNFPLTITVMVMIFILASLLICFGLFILNKIKSNNHKDSFIESCGVYIELKDEGWEFSEDLTKIWSNKTGIVRDVYKGNNLEAFTNKESILVFSVKRIEDSKIDDLRKYSTYKEMIKSMYPNGEFGEDLYEGLSRDISIWIVHSEDDGDTEVWSTIQDGFTYELRVISDRGTYGILNRQPWTPRSNINMYNIQYDVSVKYDDWYDVDKELFE